MALAFQDMLEEFGLTEKVLGFNADNATSNDTQSTKLAALDNSFEETGHVRCFNHTMQLSAKELIKPFNAGMSAATDVTTNNDMPLVNEDEDEDEDEEGADDGDTEGDDVDDEIDELDEMSEEEREEILADTAAVRETVTKVIYLTFNTLLSCSTHKRFGSCHLPSSIQQQSHSQHGAQSVLISASSLV
jgi:hypothetical protein